VQCVVGWGDSLHGHKARDEELGTGDEEQPRVAMKDDSEPIKDHSSFFICIPSSLAIFPAVSSNPIHAHSLPSTQKEW